MADFMPCLILLITFNPWMSRACCLSQFFSCVLIPPFLLQKFASSFFSICIGSCMTASRGDLIADLLCTFNQGKARAYFTNWSSASHPHLKMGGPLLKRPGDTPQIQQQFPIYSFAIPGVISWLPQSSVCDFSASK